jgi:hypothetical protein
MAGKEGSGEEERFSIDSSLNSTQPKKKMDSFPLPNISRWFVHVFPPLWFAQVADREQNLD